MSEKIRTNIKPLSVNECWQGRRYKTNAYMFYEQELLLRLPHYKPIADETKLKVEITVGVSNRAADIDNPIKPILDILQKAYSFNDRWIYKLIVNKEIVKKGKEFFEFNIEEF